MSNKITIILLLLTFLSIKLFGQNLCFSQEDKICISDLNGNNIEVLAEGNFQNPRISEDGNLIAVSENYRQNDDWYMSVVLIDRMKKKRILLENQPEKRNMLIDWIGNKDTLLIQCWNGNIWVKYFYIIKSQKAEKYLENSLNYAFNHLEKTITFYDSKNFYEYNIQGKLIREYPLNEILKEFGYSSSIDFCFSKDGNFLLFDIMDESEYQVGMGEPPSVLFVYNFNSGTLTKILPEKLGLHCMYPIWGKNLNEIIFCGFNKSQERDIYLYSQQKLTKIINNANELSSSKN